MFKKYQYFKCKLCNIFRKKTFNECVLLNFKAGGKDIFLCTYNTALSIWKWFIRFIILSITVWYVLQGFKLLPYFSWKKYGILLGVGSLISWIVTIWIGGSIVCSFIYGCLFCHHQFQEHGGIYFNFTKRKKK